MQIDLGTIGRGTRVCIEATLGGDGDLEHSSAVTTRSVGATSAAQHDSNVVSPDAGAPANTVKSFAPAAARRNSRTCGDIMHRSTNSSRERNATPVNFADVDDQVRAATDVTVHDVQSRSRNELRIMEAFGGSSLR